MKVENDKDISHDDDVNEADIASTFTQFCNDNSNTYIYNERLKITNNVNSKYSSDNNIDNNKNLNKNITSAWLCS